MTYDEDTPMELLWRDLRASPLWRTIEVKLIEKRDRMVALMVTDRPKAGVEVGVAYATQQRQLGYIECINAIVAEPAKAEKKAADAAKEKAS